MAELTMAELGIHLYLLVTSEWTQDPQPYQP